MFQRGQRPRSDDVRPQGLQGFDTAIVDGHIGIRQASDFSKEYTLAAVAFHQMNIGRGQHRAHHPWKPAPAAEIDDFGPAFGKEWHELGRIEEMALPGIEHRLRTDQVDPSLPLLQKDQVTGEAVHLVAIHAGHFLDRHGSEDLFHVKHPRRRPACGYLSLQTSLAAVLCPAAADMTQQRR